MEPLETIVMFAKLVVFLSLTLVTICGCQLIYLTVNTIRQMRAERDDSGNPR